MIGEIGFRESPEERRKKAKAIFKETRRQSKIKSGNYTIYDEIGYLNERLIEARKANNVGLVVKLEEALEERKKGVKEYERQMLVRNTADRVQGLRYLNYQDENILINASTEFSNILEQHKDKEDFESRIGAFNKKLDELIKLDEQRQQLRDKSSFLDIYNSPILSYERDYDNLFAAVPEAIFNVVGRVATKGVLFLGEVMEAPIDEIRKDKELRNKSKTMFTAFNDAEIERSEEYKSVIQELHNNIKLDQKLYNSQFLSLFLSIIVLLFVYIIWRNKIKEITIKLTEKIKSMKSEMPRNKQRIKEIVEKYISKMDNNDIIIVSIVTAVFVSSVLGYCTGETLYFRYSGTRTLQEKADYSESHINYFVAVISLIISGGLSYLFLKKNKK